jgi:hypothetical protein
MASIEIYWGHVKKAHELFHSTSPMSCVHFPLHHISMFTLVEPICSYEYW